VRRSAVGLPQHPGEPRRVRSSSQSIGRLHQQEDGDWLAEPLIDLEEDERARLRLVAALRGG
jgi:hypothetical protein